MTHIIRKRNIFIEWCVCLFVVWSVRIMCLVRHNIFIVVGSEIGLFACVRCTMHNTNIHTRTADFSSAKHERNYTIRLDATAFYCLRWCWCCWRWSLVAIIYCSCFHHRCRAARFVYDLVCYCFDDDGVNAVRSTESDWWVCKLQICRFSCTLLLLLYEVKRKIGIGWILFAYTFSGLFSFLLLLFALIHCLRSQFPIQFIFPFFSFFRSASKWILHFIFILLRFYRFEINFFFLQSMQTRIHACVRVLIRSHIFTITHARNVVCSLSLAHYHFRSRCSQFIRIN